MREVASIPPAGPGGSAPPRVPAPSRAVPTHTPEFLPAALELLVTPPSPVTSRLILTICGMFTFLAAWSVFSVIDIHAVALGKIQPSGLSKVLQSLEPARVVGVRVGEGSIVSAGDVLIELDPVETTADREAIDRDLQSAHAEIHRRRAAVSAARAAALDPSSLTALGHIDAGVIEREADAYEADMAQLRALLASQESQKLERLAAAKRLEASIAARAELIGLARERVAMRQSIESSGAGSRAMVIEAMQQLQAQLVQDSSERGQVLELAAAVASAERKMEEARAQFIADQMQKLVDAGRKRDRLEQDLAKAKSRAERTILRASISGTVQQLAVTTVGQVVSSGQVLLTLVPSDAPVEVLSMIANKDAGFIEVGQRAVVKVDAFPFTRYGTLDAEVVRIARESVSQRDVASGISNLPAPRGDGGQNLVFPVTLKLSRTTLNVDGRDVPLTPGLTVIAEVRTGERRVIDFLLSPLREAVVSVGRER